MSRQITVGSGLLVFGILFLLVATVSPPLLSLLPALIGAVSLLGAIGQFGDL